MLGKLIKYDLKASARVFVLIHAAFLVLCLGGRFFFMDRLDFSMPVKTLIAPIAIFSSVTIFVYTAIGLFTWLLVTFRFYRNLFGKEGYLSWTLPVSGVQHLWSKIISGYLFTLLDFAICAAGVVLLVSGRNVTEAYSVIAPELSAELGLTLGDFGLYLFVLSVAGGISGVIMTYFSIAVGQLFPGHRVLCAVAAYFVVSFLNQIIVFSIMAFSGYFDIFISDTATIADHLFFMLVPNTVLSLILTVAEYAATHFIMQKKINLI